MRTTTQVIISVAVAAVVSAGCAINPVSGRPEFVLVSAAKEKEIGAEAAKDIEQTMGLVDDAALVAYVESVGQRLAAQSPRRDVVYHFFVADAPEPNAFALPGGYVYVTRGLLALVNTEDELACVIGHEIGHVAARHSVQQVSRSAPFAIITGITAGVTSLASPLLGQVVGGVGGLASGLILSPFNRDQEREADRIGQQLSAKTGWDPIAMSTFLQTLSREENLRGETSRRFSFLASHPSTPERVSNTQAYARELTRVAEAPITPTHDAFLRRLDGIVVGPLAADGVFDGRAFLHPDLDFTVRFPENWKTQNSRSQVAAAAPDGNALIILNGVAKGDDPLDGARALEKAAQAPVVDKTSRTTIGGLKAARTRLTARSDSGPLSVEFAWIAYRGHIYQLAGMTPIGNAGQLTPVFDAVAESFRALRPAERAGIREDRLRIIEARSGESLGNLVSRAKGTWSPEMTAVANALTVQDQLDKGQPVKVAVSEPYAK